MKLVLQIKLLPTASQRSLLLTTMERFNAAANVAAAVGFSAGLFSPPSIQKLCYRRLRDEFGLAAQMAIRAIGKASECFRRDKRKCPRFKPHGAITYDHNILSFKGLDRVSIWCMGGRQIMPIAFGQYQSERFDRLKGQVDLVYRKGQFYLYATIDLPDRAPIEVHDFLGVDLGIANIAADSDGRSHSGEAVERVRRRHHSNRRRLQRKGTRGAKKKLRSLSGCEARFRKHVNHEISKRLVDSCKGTVRGIALEDLRGILERTTVGKKQRARHFGWSFNQLRHFIEYKAAIAGVPVAIVDPRNTSRTCSQCGHCDKGNRKDQATFLCQKCRFSLHADLNAARNVRARAICSLAPELASLTA